jgi:hypothetical protein
LRPPRRLVLEQHPRRYAIGADRRCEPRERTHQLGAARGGHRADRVDDPQLRERRCGRRETLAARGQPQLDAPAIARRRSARDEPAAHEAGDHRRHRALIGQRALGDLADRQRRRVGELVQHEQLRDRQPAGVLDLAVGEPQRANDLAERDQGRGRVVAHYWIVVSCAASVRASW